MEQTKAKLDAEVKRLQKDLENTKTSNATKINNLAAEVSELKKEREKLQAQIDQEKQSKETEVSTLKKRINSLEKTGLNTKRMNDMRQTYNEKILSKFLRCINEKHNREAYKSVKTVFYIADLENELKKGQQEYDNLTERHKEMTNLRKQFESDNEALNR